MSAPPPPAYTPHPPSAPLPSAPPPSAPPPSAPPPPFVAQPVKAPPAGAHGGGYGAVGGAGGPYGQGGGSSGPYGQAGSIGGPYGQGGNGEFAVDLCEAPCAEPVVCAVSLLCPCVYAHEHRMRLLDGDVKRYVCCNGRYSRCTSCLDGCVQGNEGCCLWAEAVCCQTCAMYTNRAMIEERFNVRDSKCDQAVQCLLVFCAALECVLRCMGHDDPNLRTFVDCFMTCFYGCMSAQHHHELNLHLGDAKSPPLLGTMAR